MSDAKINYSTLLKNDIQKMFAKNPDWLVNMINCVVLTHFQGKDYVSFHQLNEIELDSIEKLKKVLLPNQAYSSEVTTISGRVCQCLHDRDFRFTDLLGWWQEMLEQGSKQSQSKASAQVLATLQQIQQEAAAAKIMQQQFNPG